MTLAQIEERVAALEKAVGEIQIQRTPPPPKTEAESGAEIPPEQDDDAIIPGAEYPFIMTVPPREEWHIVGKIVAIDPPPAGLGLSDAEWASLDLEDEDE
jgi:hypothetical protein